jgi:hypothetical protein
MLVSSFNTRCCDKLVRITYTLEGGAECVRIGRVDVENAITCEAIELRDLADYARCEPIEMARWLNERIAEHNEQELR